MSPTTAEPPTDELPALIAPAQAPLPEATAQFIELAVAIRRHEDVASHPAVPRTTLRPRALPPADRARAGLPRPDRRKAARDRVAPVADVAGSTGDPARAEQGDGTVPAPGRRHPSGWRRPGCARGRCPVRPCCRRWSGAASGSRSIAARASARSTPRMLASAGAIDAARRRPGACSSAGRGVTKDDVTGPPRRGEPGTGSIKFRSARRWRVPGVRYRGLIDPRRLRANLEHWIDGDALHRNVRDGAVDSICCVATSLAHGRAGRLPRVGEDLATPGWRRRRIRTPGSRLAPQHVRASAATPGISRTVEIRDGGRASGTRRRSHPGPNAPVTSGDRPRRGTPDRDLVSSPIAGQDANAARFQSHRLRRCRRQRARRPAHRPGGRATSAGSRRSTRSLPTRRGPHVARGSGAYRAARGSEGRTVGLPYVLVAPARAPRARQAGRARCPYTRRYGGLGALRDPCTGRLWPAPWGGGPSRG